MKRISSLTILIFFAALFLIMNTMGVFHYRDTILLCETRKDSMFNLNLKYDTLVNHLRNNANLYLLTNDSRYYTQYNILMNDYTRENNVNLGYRTFTEEQATQKLKAVDPTREFTLKSQVKFLEFNQEEAALYRDYLHSINSLIDSIQLALETKDPSIFLDKEFALDYIDQSESMTKLMRSYIERLNRQEDSTLTNQRILEGTMILFTCLVMGTAVICFYLLMKENRSNSYFRQLYTTVVENINVGLCILDKNGRFEYVNPAYKDIMENDSDYKGMRPFDLLGTEVDKIINIPPGGFRAREGGNQQMEIHGETKEIQYEHFTIHVQQDSKKYVDLITDITQTAKMERQMKEQLDEIRYYSGAKDSFIANMSHEIKTPINAILGMSHFLKNTELTVHQKDLVGKIESSSDVLLSIINDVLDFSKMKSRELTLYPVAFPLLDVVHSVRDMFQAQMQEKNLEWKEFVAVDPELCLVLDRTRFLQVLVNLVGNACKFTNRGHISLSVHVVEEQEKSILLQFRVEDTGIGMQAKDMGKLFHEFEQLENHLSKKHTGTGLGLAICKQIVSAMGGEIWAESDKGKGSRFFFTIPAPKALPSDLMANSNPASKPRPNGQGQRILVVEDTEINAEVVETLLNEVNIVCDKAGDGVEAVELCKAHGPDYYRLILMDIHMPRMNGYEASAVLKQDLKITSPILALTATSVDEKIRQDCEGTIDDFILKPIKADEFYEILCDYFPREDVSESEVPVAEAAPAAPAIPEAEAAPDPIDKMEEAIHNMGGIEAIYFKHLNKFKKNYVDTPAQIQASLDQDDYEEARRLAHSVKGLSGTLGMSALQDAAYVLEMKIAERAPDASSALESFTICLQAVIDYPISSTNS